MCITKNGSENREPFLADHLKKEEDMGYVLFSGCVTGIAGDQFRGNSPVSGPDGGKEHRAAQLYGGAAWEMCGKGLVEAVCTGACAPAVFLWQNPDGNGNRVCTTGKNPVTGGAVSGSFPELLPKEPSENLQKVTLWHLLTMSCGHETEIDMESPDWIREFLQHPFYMSREHFINTIRRAQTCLAAVLKRKTGCDVTEFLKPRLLEPLGITSLTCSKCRDRKQWKWLAAVCG